MFRLASSFPKDWKGQAMKTSIVVLGFVLLLVWAVDSAIEHDPLSREPTASQAEFDKNKVSLMPGRNASGRPALIIRNASDQRLGAFG